MKRARAHHYLPQFYLNGFTSSELVDKGYLWVYEKNKPVRKSKPVNEAHERDLYAYKGNDGNVHDIEQALSAIESALAPLFTGISQGHHQFHPNDWKSLTLFIAMMWVRGPMGRDLVSKLCEDAMASLTRKLARDKEGFETRYQRFVENSEDTVALTAEEMRQFMLSDEWIVKQESYGATLGQMFTVAMYVADILAAKPWEVLVAPQGHFFCTTDVPVITARPDSENRAVIGFGFGVPGVHVFFPLNKIHCLTLRDRASCKGKAVKAWEVREINKFMMHGAKRFLYSPEKNPAIAKLFDKIGCESKPGVNAFMSSPPPDDRAA